MPTLAQTGLTLANGIGWSPECDRIYVVDTGTASVLSAWLDDHGHPRTAFDTLLDLAAAPGVPDGLCVDADGGIWLAMFGAGQVRSYDPSGKLREKIDLPLRYPTSLAFAGPLLEDLVITTARRTPKMSDPSAQAGKLIATRPGLRGTH